MILNGWTKTADAMSPRSQQKSYATLFCKCKISTTNILLIKLPIG